MIVNKIPVKIYRFSIVSFVCRWFDWWHLMAWSTALMVVWRGPRKWSCTIEQLDGKRLPSHTGSCPQASPCCPGSSKLFWHSKRQTVLSSNWTEHRRRKDYCTFGNACTDKPWFRRKRCLKNLHSEARRPYCKWGIQSGVKHLENRRVALHRFIFLTFEWQTCIHFFHI